MGLTGLTVAWQRAEQHFRWPQAVSSGLLPLATLVFVVLAALYTLKLLRYPHEVRAELAHPVKLAFVPAISIALLLLATAWLPFAPGAAYALWLAGSVLHLAATLYVLSSWMHHAHYQIGHLSPAWFIPVVGNILVPVIGVQLAPLEVSWFFFAIGIFFWPVLTAILFYRLVFHPALPQRLLPTLFILIAPPAVGLLAYTNLTGALDAFAQVLYGVALFFTLLLATQVRAFARLPFFLSWWAYSFPLAAVTLATLRMARLTGGALYDRLALLLLAVATVAIALLFARTLLAVARREICVEEAPAAAPAAAATPGRG